MKKRIDTVGNAVIPLSIGMPYRTGGIELDCPPPYIIVAELYGVADMIMVGILHYCLQGLGISSAGLALHWTTLATIPNEEIKLKTSFLLEII